MIPNYHKHAYKYQEYPTKINANENKVVRMLAIDSSEDNVSLNCEKKIVVKPPHGSWKLQSTQKLEVMMGKLRKDITVVMNYGEKRNKAISDHPVFIRLDLLNTCIEQVVYIKDVIRRGGTIFLESLFSMQKKTNDTLYKIREDVFKAYLDLETEDKYSIARQGGQMTCVFTLLGIIERELHATYEKISQAISKRNQHKHKNNKAVTDLFTSFRSLPVLQSSKQKSKEKLTYIKKNKEKNNVDNSEPENIPPDKQRGSEKIEAYDHSLKDPFTNITKNTELLTNVSENSLSSSSPNAEDKLKEDFSVNEVSSDNELYQDCSSPVDIEPIECKATGFEINISDENIQIKIPTSVIYLVRNSNCKNIVKSESEQGDNQDNRETGHHSLTWQLPVSSGSVNSFNAKNKNSEESISSLYTDVITDSEIAMEYEKSSTFKTKLIYNCKKKNKIIDYNKCYPFYADNVYCNPVSKENELTRNIQAEIKAEKEEIDKHVPKESVFSIMKENNKLASEYGSKFCTLGNPLFGNILQLVDLVKKIYSDCNDETTFDHKKDLNVLTNIEKTNSVPSTVLQHYNDRPPSISEASFDGCSSLWKESASRLCEICPGCVTLAKLSNEGLLKEERK